MAVTFSFPTTVLFGAGTVRELPRRLAALGCSKPLLVTDRGLVETPAFRTVEAMSQGQWPVFAGVTPNPAEGDVELGAEMFRSLECDAVIALGGGSALDVGKVLRIRAQWPDVAFRKFDPPASPPPLAPCITIPTTAGTGSEVGRSSVVILDGRKAVIFHPALLARLVILDPELTVGLPPFITAATGMDALTHNLEAYVAKGDHPLADAIALDGLRRIGQHLGRAVKNGKDIEAREQMLLGSAMGAIAFQKGLGACHSVAHALTPVAGTHHGLANSLMLPTVIQFNRSAAEERLATAAVVLGADPRMNAQERAHACAHIVDDLRAACGLPRKLSQAGVKREMIPRLVEKAMADACHQSNPRACTQVDFERIIEEAF